MPVPTQDNFASILEARASEPQDFVCFLDSETGQTCTYFELRLRGVWLARELEAQDVARGGVCAVDMQNCPALLYAVVAAAYGGFSLVMLNSNLSVAEKKSRIKEVKRALKLKNLPVLTEDIAMALVADAEVSGANARGVLSQWAHRGVGAFDDAATALYFLTAATAGKPKIVGLSWTAVMGAARACNAAFNIENEGVWQLVIPANHIDGVSVFFRSVLNHNAFIMYRTFDAAKVLKDGKKFSATHIAVFDKSLQDLLNLNEDPGDAAEEMAQLDEYTCILLGGAQPNKHVFIRALGQKAPLYVAYGLLETASYVAFGRLTDTEEIHLEPLAGYELEVVSPDDSGFGQLAVRGPGVIDSYVNARAAFTADGFFLTDDKARQVDGAFEIREKASDKFVSGGEDIYPEEIRNKLMTFEGVTDAVVFGARDNTWGRRPVAFVEAKEGAARPGFNAFYFSDDMRNRLTSRLSPVYMPDQFVVMNEFPRTGMGSISTGTLERMWDARLQVEKVEVWQLRLPLVGPIRNAKVRLRNRDVALVRLTDFAGRTGIGECPAFVSDWYTEETLVEDIPLLRDVLGPLLVGRALLHPSDATELFENAPDAAQAPFARAALETALWDLYGKVRGRSIRALIGARDEASEAGALHEVPAGCVEGGVVINLGSVGEMLAATNEAVQAGYRRIKLKIKPGTDVDVVQAVRTQHPDIMLMLDADMSYRDDQLDVLQQLDEFNVETIEEPLDPAFTPAVGPTDLFDRLARLQAQLRMRVCLDESWSTGEELCNILDAHPELRCVSLKIGKFGGVGAALEFYRWARERGIEVWPGGMYDTGVSKRLHAAFALLPGVNIPGDLSDSARYFTVDVTDPPFVLEDGILLVNDDAHAAGLGCDLNEAILANVTENYWVCA